MKVIILHTRANSPRILGGNYRHIYNWATSLKKNHIDVLVCLAGPNICVVNDLASQYSSAGIRTTVLHNCDSFVKALLGKGKRQLREVISKERPNIVHTLNIQSDILSAYNKHFGKYKCLSSIEGALYPNDNSIKSKSYRFLNRCLRDRIDLNLAISKYTLLQHVERGDISRDKSQVLYSGIDLSLFHPRGNVNKGCEVVGFLGRISEGKCPDLFIEVAYLLCKVGIKQKYIMGGDGPMLEGCKKMVKDYGLENQFEFTGAVENVPDFLNKVDLFLFLSEREGLPWIVLETMASNVPIIASSVGGVPEVITNNVTGVLLKDNDIETVFNSVKGAIMNYNKHVQMTRVARNFIVENFTIDIETRNLIAFYDYLLEGDHKE